MRAVAFNATRAFIRGCNALAPSMFDPRAIFGMEWNGKWTAAHKIDPDDRPCYDQYVHYDLKCTASLMGWMTVAYRDIEHKNMSVPVVGGTEGIMTTLAQWIDVGRDIISYWDAGQWCAGREFNSMLMLEYLDAVDKLFDPILHLDPDGAGFQRGYYKYRRTEMARITSMVIDVASDEDLSKLIFAKVKEADHYILLSFISETQTMDMATNIECRACVTQALQATVMSIMAQYGLEAIQHGSRDHGDADDADEPDDDIGEPMGNA
jgi:hypothetical protein